MNVLVTERPASAIVRSVREQLGKRPDLRSRYTNAKAIVRKFRTPAFYEVSTRCNLFCEGCYYFEASEGNRSPADPKSDPDEWERFFAREAERKVTMAYFLGAEPALEPDRLRAAARHFSDGNIGTNGTIRIAPDIPFRISISVWGDTQTDRKMRGSDAFSKALRLYEGDERAIALYTVNAWNIDAIPAIAQRCADLGMDLTFSFFSPTHQFKRKVSSGAPNDNAYFRVSAPANSPEFGADDLARAHDAIDRAMDDFPQSVIFSKAFNRWITTPGSLYKLDANNVAQDCGSRIVGRMKYYGANFEPLDIKCCTPDIDCANCRMHSGAWSSRFTPSAADVSDVVAFENWLEAIETLGRIFLLARP